MKSLLAGATVIAALLVITDAAFAQACSRACGSANAQCQSSAASLGSACVRACGKRASCIATCEKQQRTAAASCSRNYRVCLRGCGGR